MSDPAKPKLRYVDLLRETRPDKPMAELIDGVIHRKASPRLRHGVAQVGIARMTEPSEDGSGDDPWWIVIEPDVIFTEHTVLRPDVAGWRKVRLPIPPDAPTAVLPDLICEVLSPGHERYDRLTKREIYQAHGVPFIWLVDPTIRIVEAYGLHGDMYVHLGTWGDEDHQARIPPFEFLVDVARLFVPRPDEPLIVAEAQRVHYG